MNRSFWTAATSSGFVVNSPVSNFTQHNTAETLFERLEAHGRYVQEPMALSFTGMIHMPRLKDRLATNFVPYSEFEQDAANGTLPDFSLIEPNLTAGTATTTPPALERCLPEARRSRSIPRPRSGAARRFCPASTTRSARPLPQGAPTPTTRCSSSAGMSPAAPTTTSHPGPSRRRTRAPRPGRWASSSDRSGYRLPAIIVSPWVDEGIVVNEEHRHTSMIATLRKVWGLGDAFTARDAAAPFDHLLSRERPRDPASWPDVEALPVPEFHLDLVQMGKALSTLGKTAGGGMLEHAKQSGIEIPAELADPDAHSSAEQILAAVRSVAGQFFPRLAAGKMAGL